MRIAVANFGIGASPRYAERNGWFDKSGLKRAALLFDQIVPLTITEALRSCVGPFTKDQIQFQEELDWLHEIGICLDIEDDFKGVLDDEDVMQFRLHCPTAAAAYRNKKGVDAVALGPNEKSLTTALEPGDDPVVQIILKNLPLPNDSTPWEAILEWRSDEQAQLKLRRLRNWMNKIALSSESPRIIEDELLVLLDEYRCHTELHKLKANTSLLQTFLVTTADIAGNLASFKWGKAVEKLFILRDRRIRLLEAERDAPGREIAYIDEARRVFK